MTRQGVALLVLGDAESEITGFTCRRQWLNMCITQCISIERSRSVDIESDTRARSSISLYRESS